MGATLKDIAQEAGVSVSTVSRILNTGHADKFRPSTVERIRAIAAKHGYQPNFQARQLRMQSQEALPPVQTKVAELGYALKVPNTQASMPINLPIINGVEEEATRLGYRVSFRQYLTNLEGEYYVDEVCAYLEQGNGLIIIGTPEGKERTILAQYRKNLVVAYGDLWQEEVDSIEEDDVTGNRELVDYLVAKGHQRIALIGGFENDHRWRSLLAALGEHGITPPDQYIRQCEYLYDRAYQAAKEMVELPTPPTAVCASSDIMAAAAIKALKDAGVRVPEDMAVTGFGDISIARSMDPPLTTVRMELTLMGQIAVRLLQERLLNLRDKPVYVKTPAKLVVRSSA